jgi:hypothetical protein
MSRPIRNLVINGNPGLVSSQCETLRSSTFLDCNRNIVPMDPTQRICGSYHVITCVRDRKQKGGLRAQVCDWRSRCKKQKRLRHGSSSNNPRGNKTLRINIPIHISKSSSRIDNRIHDKRDRENMAEYFPGTTIKPPTVEKCRLNIQWFTG